MFSRFSKSKRHHLLAFWAFVLPSLLVFAVFIYYPVFYNFRHSFFETNVLSDVSSFVGFGNYRRLFKDEMFRRALINTGIFTAAMLLVRLPLALLIGLLLNQKVKGQGFFRALVFSPSLTATAAVALLWVWIFEPSYGLINASLSGLGIQGPGWLGSTRWSLSAVMLMSIWKGVGYDAVIYLAGLQSVPRDLYEAAELDGADTFQRFRFVTLPLLSPVTFFLIVTAVIGSFQVFDAVAVMTQGGPLGSSSVYVHYLYQKAFEYFDNGFASAMAVLLLGLVLVLTVLQLRFARRWVHY